MVPRNKTSKHRFLSTPFQPVTTEATPPTTTTPPPPPPPPPPHRRPPPKQTPGVTHVWSAEDVGMVQWTRSGERGTMGMVSHKTPFYFLSRGGPVPLD